jgi:DNA-binding response OmpR family regulator
VGSTRRILVFDDDLNMLSIMRYILEEQQWNIMTAEKCNDAINIISNYHPSIILMDNKIPDYGGVYMIRLIKQHQELQHIPVILFSANPDIKDLAREAGADAYLAKPFGLNQLNKIIEDFIKK